MTSADYDIFVVGGGVNGCGIARDAAGRGLKVGLAEMNDLASATSSASTKLFHGGLRYLEYLEIRLVREALTEREILLQMMPHISWPMRFILPTHKDMRFSGGTPVSKMLSFVMPWMKGRRPRWLIRTALFFYDHLGGRKILPATSTLKLKEVAEGQGLNPKFVHAFEYSDCWVEDSRLVALNARDAKERRADIMVQTKVVSADRQADHWTVSLQAPDGAIKTVTAKLLVNSAGPWVEDVVRQKLGQNATEGVRLVKGSHIVVNRVFDHDKSYFFQGSDGRIIFAIPYETDFTLIGTTDVEHHDVDTAPECSDEERDYLLKFINGYLAKPLSPDDVRWKFSGVRPLYDDGAAEAKAATRDYVLTMNTDAAPILNIFGGKITSYRELSEHVLKDLGQVLDTGTPWTAGSSLPGGDFAVADTDKLAQKLQDDYPFLDERWALRLFRAYGTDAWDLLGDATSADDLGDTFGSNLTRVEVDWLYAHEFARKAADILWRRSKLGLRVDAQDTEKLDRYLEELNTAANA